MKINFVGNFFGITGYAKHMQGLSLAMKKLNDETSVLTELPQNWEKTVTQEQYDLLKGQVHHDGFQVMITHPIGCLLHYKEQNKGLLPFFVFEGDKAPKQWVLISELPNIHKILTPSNHSKQALINAGIKEDKIVIIPHGYNPEHFKPRQTYDSDKCVFIWNKGWSKGVADRSGFHITLRAFVEEFHNNQDVMMIAHINPTYNPPNWNIEEEIKKLNIPEMNTKFCSIAFNIDAIPDEYIHQIYEQGQFYLGTTTADAFNIPVLEAMACGLIPIITSFGGHTDYASNGFVVGGELKPAPITNIQDLPLYEQTNWLEPNKDELKKALRRSYNLWKDKELMEQKRKQIIEDVKDWTWTHSATKLKKIIEELK